MVLAEWGEHITGKWSTETSNFSQSFFPSQSLKTTQVRLWKVLSPKVFSWSSSVLISSRSNRDLSLSVTWDLLLPLSNRIRTGEDLVPLYATALAVCSRTTPLVLAVVVVVVDFVSSCSIFSCCWAVGGVGETLWLQMDWWWRFLHHRQHVVLVHVFDRWLFFRQIKQHPSLRRIFFRSWGSFILSHETEKWLPMQ